MSIFTRFTALVAAPLRSAAVAATAIVGLTVGLNSHLPAVSPGSAAPAISLTSSTGQAINLSDYAGKTVVLEWINFSCPFVKKFYSKGDMPQFQTTAQEHGAVWLSICSSAPGKQGHLSADAIPAALEKNGWSGDAYLIDESGSVGKAYGAKTTPHMYIVQVADDGTATVLYNGAIDSIKSFKQADIAKATNYVLQGLKELKAGQEISVAASPAYGCSVKY